MNIAANTKAAIGSRVRDLVAARFYPRYSTCKAALFAGRTEIQSACREGLKFRHDSASWGDEQKLDWILRRLRLAVRRAYLDTSYYREQLDRLGFNPFLDFGFRDFAGLPILEKDHILKAGPRLVSKLIPRGSLREDATGGSTGAPVHVWLGPEERGWRQSASAWVFDRLGLPRGSRIAYFWGHNLDPRGRGSFKERAYFYLNNTEWLDCFRLEPGVLEDYHKRLVSFRPACIIAYASALGALAEHLLDHAYQPRYPSRFILTGAEKLTEQHRHWAQSAFDCPIVERYGARDVGLIGFQSRISSSSRVFEIDWANVLIEPESGKREASILVTKLHADGMPMIRYRIGDVGWFPSSAMPGHPTFFLDEVVGRELEKIWLPNGSWVQGTVAPHLLKDYPVREYQLVQEKDYSVELQIVPRNGFGEPHRRDIVRLLSNNLGGLKVTAILVDRIPRTQASKLRSVVSHVTGNGRRDCSA
jgi:phenylacetate-CoA ligase